MKTTLVSLALAVAACTSTVKGEGPPSGSTSSTSSSSSSSSSGDVSASGSTSGGGTAFCANFTDCRETPWCNCPVGERLGTWDCVSNECQVDCSLACQN